jgi:hypothetical protein
MKPNAVAVLLLTLALQGCTVTRYAKVRVLSDPALAHVSLVQTGEFLQSTPGTAIVRARFRLWQPRRVTWQLRFRKRDMCDAVVPLTIAGPWQRTRREAEASLDVINVHGLLPQPPCAAASSPLLVAPSHAVLR